MVSSELPEVIGMSDRVIVMREGAITGELADRKDFTEVNLLSHAMGDSKDDKE
jgi:L-arabinose transport system ATP-binding protein